MGDSLSQATLTSTVESEDRLPAAAVAAYLLKASAYAALLWAASRLSQTSGALGAAFLLLLVAFPILTATAYRSTLRRIHFLSAMNPAGRIARLLSGAYLRVLLALPLALWSAASLVVGAERQGGELWLGITVLAALVGLCYGLVWPMVSREVQPWFRFIPASRIAVTVAVSATGTVLLLLGGASDHVAFANLAEAIDAQPHYQGSSNLLATLFAAMAIFHGLGAYALGAGVDLVSVSAAFLYTVGLFAGLFGLARAFTAFVVPGREYARVFATPAPSPSPPRASRRRIAVASALVTFIVGFVYVPGVAVLEGALTPPATSPPAAAPTIAEPVARAREVMEKIDEVVVRPGTIERVAALRADFLDRIRARQTNLEPLARAGFAAMRANVPAYLDAYYGLPAEYARLGQLLIGDFEAYVSDQLRSYLELGEPFAAFETELAEVEAFTAASVSEYAAEVSRLVAENTVVPIEGELPDFAATATFTGLIAAIHFDDAIALPARLGAGVAAGAATAGAVVAAKAIAKLTAKGTIQLAAAALAKLAGGKFAAGGAGSLVGAFIGGAVGSLVPGAGTAPGALIGGAAGGILVGVGVDYLLLKLEEELSRDQFEAEILASIDEAEAEVLAAFE